MEVISYVKLVQRSYASYTGECVTLILQFHIYSTDLQLLWQACSGNLLVCLMPSTSKPFVISSYALRGELTLQRCLSHIVQACYNMAKQVASEQLYDIQL
jgi:hypothetical protein